MTVLLQIHSNLENSISALQAVATPCTPYICQSTYSSPLLELIILYVELFLFKLLCCLYLLLRSQITQNW